MCKKCNKLFVRNEDVKNIASTSIKKLILRRNVDCVICEINYKAVNNIGQITNFLMNYAHTLPNANTNQDTLRNVSAL